MRNSKRILALLLALVMVLQLAPVAFAEDAAAEKVAAVYTSDPSTISAAAVGYYWDAANLYYADGEKVNTYSLKELDVALTDYNQTHNVTIGDDALAVTFLAAIGSEILALDNSNWWTHSAFGYNFTADGTALVFDNESTIDESISVTDTSKTTPYARKSSNNVAAISHASDIYLEQTLKFDVLPAKSVSDHGVFVGASVTTVGGYSFFIWNRDSAASVAFLATVQNVGDGKLQLFVANSNFASGYGSTGIDLGVSVGEKFVLGTQWNADGGADIYVNDNYITTLADATRGGLGGNYSTGNYVVFDYTNIGTADAKFTVSDVTVSNGRPASVAEDTTTKSLEEILNGLSNITGDVILPTAVVYAHGAMPITWASSDESIVALDGTVNVPAEKTTVTLTATCAGKSASVDAIVSEAIVTKVVSAKLTSNAAAESAGYYWDAKNFYIVSGEGVNTYALADLGVSFSDINTAYEFYIGEQPYKAVFALPNGTSIIAMDGTNWFNHTGFNFNYTIDGAMITFDNETTIDAAVSVTDSAKVDPYGCLYSANTSGIDHTKDLYLEQTMKFDALPDKPVADGQVFIGAKDYAKGFVFALSNRDSSTAPVMLATIQKLEDNSLQLLFANDGTFSAGSSAAFDLGVSIGEKFVLGTQWNADASVDVYVNGVYIGTAAKAERQLSGIVPSGNYYFTNYSTLEGNAKFTISDIAVYEGKLKSLSGISTADIVESAYTGEITNNLPYSYRGLPVVWTAIENTLEASGKVYRSAEAKTVTLTANILGIALASCEKTIPASTVAYTDLGVDYASVLTFPGQINGGASFNFAVAGNVLSYDNETAMDAATSITDASKNGEASAASYSRVYQIDHTAYDLLLEQTVCIDALPATTDINCFVGNTLNAKGISLFIDDRYDYANGGENVMLASIQHYNGGLYLIFANNGTFSSGTSGWCNLGKNLGETFNLAIRWNKDNSAEVYVDGVKLTVRDNGTANNAADKVTAACRPMAYKGADSFGYKVKADVLPGDIKFTITDVKLSSIGTVATYDGVEYQNLQAAINMAQDAYTTTGAVQTVLLTGGEVPSGTVAPEIVAGEITIPVGVKLEMAGRCIVMDSLFVTGNIVNSDKNGYFVVNGNISIQNENEQLPVYQSIYGRYRLFDYDPITRGPKITDNSFAVGFSAGFDDGNAYGLFSQGDAKVDFFFEVYVLNGDEEINKVYQVSDEMMNKYAELAVSSGSVGSLASLVLTLTNTDLLAEGDYISITPYMTNEIGMKIYGEFIEYEVPAAEEVA